MFRGPRDIPRIQRAGVAGVLDAWRQREEHIRIAADQRQLGQYLRVDCGAERAGLSAQNSGLTGHRDALGDFAQGQRDIDGRGLAGLQLHAILPEALEAGVLGFQPVDASIDEREAVESRSIARLAVDRAGPDAG